MRRILSLLTALGVGLALAGPASASVARVVEFDIPSTGVPEGLALGPDGALWFSERYTTQLGRMTLAGRFRMFSFSSPNHHTTDITAGPDGALWFTFPNSVSPYSSGRIGRITTAGQSRFFDIPWVSDAESITTGPDGNLWFADHVAAAIVRLTPSGTFTRFDIPGPQGTYPWQITAGPDGALWFTDFNARRVGRITTAGQVSFFDVTAPDGYPNAIAAGPDGNVWFTLDEEPIVIRITPSGAMTEFPVDHPDGDYIAMSGIAAAGSNALAFSYFDVVTGESLIGRITTSGATTMMATPSPNSAPHAVAAGPDGSVWVSEITGPSIAGLTRR